MKFGKTNFIQLFCLFVLCQIYLFIYSFIQKVARIN